MEWREGFGALQLLMELSVVVVKGQESNLKISYKESNLDQGLEERSVFLVST